MYILQYEATIQDCFVKQCILCRYRIMKQIFYQNYTLHEKTRVMHISKMLYIGLNVKEDRILLFDINVRQRG